MDAITWAASAMSAAQRRLDIATENLANAQSDGFRKILAQGKLTARGVRIFRVRSHAHGALRPTHRPFDLAILGDGAFRVRDAHGKITSTRHGNFSRDRFAVVRDALGNALLGQHGPLVVPKDAHIDTRGRVVRAGKVLDRIALPRGSRLRSGWLETASVDAIGQMIDVLDAQRSFETAQRVVSAIDATHKEAASHVASLA